MNLNTVFDCFIVFFAIFAVASFVLRNKQLLADVPFSKDYSLIGKGVAITLVVFSHIGNVMNIRYLAPFGGSGVAMFLILSGYGINESWKKNGYKNYWKKRLIGVYFPYLFIEIITLPIRGGYDSPLELLLDLTAIRSQYFLGWYVKFQFFMYLLFYLIMRFVRDKKIRCSLWCIIGFIILLSPNMLYGRQAFTFAFGVLLSEYKSCFVLLKQKKVFVLIGMLAVVLLCVKQIPIVRTTPVVIQNTIDMVMSTGFAVFILFLINVVHRQLLVPLYYLGIVSYEMYLTHGYTLRLFKLDFSFRVVNGLLFFALTIVVAVVLHLVIKLIQNKLSSVLKRDYL